MRILVADDDATIRTELADLLRQEGHDVETAGDGRQAIERIEGEAFDLALLDLVMPRATGLDVLRRIRVSRPETEVIMITGQGTIEAAVDAMKAGARDFVEKPFEIESLDRILRGLEEERHTRRILAGSSGDAAATVEGILADAASRGALLAVVGPEAPPPRGADPVLRVVADGASGGSFSPSQLYQLNGEIERYLMRTNRPVVSLGDLASLVERHGREDVLAWIRQLAERAGTRGGAVVLRARDRTLLPDVAGARVLPGDERLQRMLESLANPARRSIVGYVFASGPVPYSSILRRNYVDSSSKLSFHLGKLQADGLLKKVQGGAYALSEDGRRAWQVLRTLADASGRARLLVEAESASVNGSRQGDLPPVNPPRPAHL